MITVRKGFGTDTGELAGKSERQWKDITMKSRRRKWTGRRNQELCTWDSKAGYEPISVGSDPPQAYKCFDSPQISRCKELGKRMCKVKSHSVIRFSYLHPPHREFCRHSWPFTWEWVVHCSWFNSASGQLSLCFNWWSVCVSIMFTFSFVLRSTGVSALLSGFIQIMEIRKKSWTFRGKVKEIFTEKSQKLPRKIVHVFRLENVMEFFFKHEIHPSIFATKPKPRWLLLMGHSGNGRACWQQFEWLWPSLTVTGLQESWNCCHHSIL